MIKDLPKRLYIMTSKSLFVGSSAGFILALINPIIKMLPIPSLSTLFLIITVTIFTIIGGVGAHFVIKALDQGSLLEATIAGTLTGYVSILAYFVVDRSIKDFLDGYMANEITFGLVAATAGASIACIYFIYESFRKKPQNPQ